MTAIGTDMGLMAPAWWRRIRELRERDGHSHAAVEVERQSAELLGRLNQLTDDLEVLVSEREEELGVQPAPQRRHDDPRARRPARGHP